jgi:hypothetical protein
VNRKSFIPGRKDLPSVFTYSKARKAGISAERLYAYRNEGLLDQIGRGLYRWADAPEIDQDLLEVAYRAPRATLCLSTALARHGLTDAIPDRVNVAIPRGGRVPSLRPVVDIHVFCLAQMAASQRFETCITVGNGKAFARRRNGRQERVRICPLIRVTDAVIASNPGRVWDPTTRQWT